MGEERSAAEDILEADGSDQNAKVPSWRASCARVAFGPRSLTVVRVIGKWVLGMATESVSSGG